MHYYSFNVGDYYSHTRGLTLLQDITYRRLLDMLYLTEKPLSLNSQHLARRIDMRDHVDDVELVCQEYFTRTEEGWTQDRAMAEIAKFHAKIEQATKAGQASAQRRLNGSSTTPQPTNNHKPRTKNQHSSSVDEGVVVSLNSFWERYPRRKNTSKADALKAWSKMSNDERTLAMKAVAVFASSCIDQNVEERFIPHASTWLNGKRWESFDSNDKPHQTWI